MTVSNDSSKIQNAVRALMSGELIIMPTETVYGLAADATNSLAVARIFEAKGRPRFNPLIVHVSNIDMAERHVIIGERAEKLMRHFWPGPLTFVLQKQAGSPVADLVSAGLATIAVRAPDHRVAQALMKQAGRPLAAPSANPSGSLSPTKLEHIAPAICDAASVALDGGSCAYGLESTVLGFEDADIVLLRAGAIAASDIEAVVGPLQRTSSHQGLGSPGRLLSHYAPQTPLKLNAIMVEESDALLAFGPGVPQGAKITLNLSPSGSLREAAANFFAFLAELDAQGHKRIAVMPIPNQGLGEAINDRLTRAVHLT